MDVVAFQPSLWLWPSTIQNGVPLPATETVSEVRPWWSTVTGGRWWDGGADRSPAAVSGSAAPPAADPRLSASTASPVAWYVAVVRVWVPGPSVIPWAASPHPRTVSPPLVRALEVEPVTSMSTGCPSTATRSE